MNDPNQAEPSQTSIAHAAEPASEQIVIVTGMSGAGKTQALKALEDIGFEAVDNLPLSLLPNVIRPQDGVQRLAIGIDIRTRDFGVEPFLNAFDRLVAEKGQGIQVIFLDCDDEVLTRRYTETRRRHPLAVDRPLIDGIRHERSLVAELRSRPDVMVIDTSYLPPAELKRLLAMRLGVEQEKGLVIFITSFAYRNGLPREADLVFDTRFLDNPHYIPELQPLTGRDEAVAAHVAADPMFHQFFKSMTDLIKPLLPRFAAEGKSYLTIGIGCTGGRHRSVFVAERLAAWLKQQGARVELRHRELDQGGAG